MNELGFGYVAKQAKLDCGDSERLWNMLSLWTSILFLQVDAQHPFGIPGNDRAQ